MTNQLPALRTILLATDGSDDAALAGRVAADLASRTGAALHLVHAWMSVPAASYPYPAMPPASAYQLYQTDAAAVLVAAANALTTAGVQPAATHLHYGQPIGAITALGEELDADLIVVGSRGLGPLRRLVLGSVSSGLAHQTTRPLLVVRGGETAWPPARIVVGDDGTPAARQAGALAASFAKVYGTPLTLVRTCAPLPRDATRAGDELIRRTTGMAPLGDDRAIAIREEIFGRATALLHDHAVQLQGEGIAEIATEVIFGDPAAAIVEAAEAASAPALIVVGTRGLGTMARLRLGSVSTKVLHAALCPVLVVPQR